MLRLYSSGDRKETSLCSSTLMHYQCPIVRDYDLLAPNDFNSVIVLLVPINENEELSEILSALIGPKEGLESVSQTVISMKFQC